jgi:hypothetical protein
MAFDPSKTRLRPVVYTTNKFKSGSQNTTQQILLLKALQVTSDPEKLRQMIHVRSVAEVYKTLDKMSMRKEYHKALARSGISFDFVVEGIKGIAEKGDKDADRLKAYQTLLKSVGLDKYDSDAGTGAGTWEEELLRSIEEKKTPDRLGNVEEKKVVKYDVAIPEVPESAKKKQEEEDEIISSIYDEKK